MTLYTLWFRIIIDKVKLKQYRIVGNRDPCFYVCFANIETMLNKQWLPEAMQEGGNLRRVR